MKKIFSQIAILCMASMTFFACTKVEEMDNRTNPLPIPHNDEVETVLQGLTISPRTNYVVVGDELTLTATANPANAVLGNLAWTSSNPGVASVDGNGRVKALTTGMALVTAASGNVSVTAIVNVFAERVPATAISLSKTEVTLLVGRATKIRATLLPDGSEEGQPGTTDQLDLAWSSSNENVATVNYGFVQAVGLGEATLTARQGDLTATVKVTVADQVKLQDRSLAWKLSDTPKWDKDWSGNISGSHEEVALEGFDADLAYFKVVAADKFTDVETVSN
ncbi:MAG: Ig domain-containing protein, partial [Bacteroidales bacterium]|nr:Ig domain-containing protein [Bacteroidales bacterium]